VKNLTQNIGAEKPKAMLKRKVGYTEEQVSTTRAKLSEMDIDTTDKESNTDSQAAAQGSTLVVQ
jgi:hypothetical protein